MIIQYVCTACNHVQSRKGLCETCGKVADRALRYASPAEHIYVEFPREGAGYGDGRVEVYRNPMLAEKSERAWRVGEFRTMEGAALHAERPSLWPTVRDAERAALSQNEQEYAVSRG